MFVAGGFEVIDLGINVAPQAFVEAVNKHVKVIVGCAPITADYAEQIGADLYGENAIEAVEVVKKALAK